MTFTFSEMLAHTKAQLAVDLNCAPEDFGGEGFVFCESKENPPAARQNEAPRRRPFPRGPRHLDMVNLGGATVVSASADLLPFLRQELAGKTRDEAFARPWAAGQSLYYLPDPARLAAAAAQPPPAGIALELVEREGIPALYEVEGFRNAVQYDVNHPRPDVLAIVARTENSGEVVGMAGMSADCAMLWQIGIDVVPAHRGGGLAAALVSRLSAETLRRGKVPYYGTSSANIPSQRVAARVGYVPVWAALYRGWFDGEYTLPCG